MDISFWSLISFLIVLICYFKWPSGYWGYIPVSLSDVSGTDLTAMKEKTHRNSIALALFVAVVSVVQFILNIGYLLQKCGGSLSGSIAGSAALFTFIPWVLIFGIMVAVLSVFPGFKTAFSDVIGYYAVAWHANDILAKVLPTDIQNKIDQLDPASQQETRVAAEAILKMAGNRGVMINIMNPVNFWGIWNKLVVLMPKEMSQEERDINAKALFDLVIYKDIIGESLWYIYTAILISSIVYYNLATRGCVKDPQMLKKEHDDYINKIEAADKEQATANSTKYTN